MNFRLINRTARNQADSGTVRYDLDMLAETAGRYVDAERYKDVVGMNMAIESFAIHCRAMIQFLFGHLEWIERPGAVQERFPPPRPTDVFARKIFGQGGRPATARDSRGRWGAGGQLTYGGS